jgi:hypothetical protein
MFDVKAAVAALTDFGLAIEPWMPQRADGTSKVQIGGGKARPIVKVSDLPTFRGTWPNGDEVVMQGLNGGQSLRVKLQAVIRTKVEANHKIGDDDLIEAQLTAMLGVRAPTSAALSDETLLAEARRRGLIE